MASGFHWYFFLQWVCFSGSLCSKSAFPQAPVSPSFSGASHTTLSKSYACFYLRFRNVLKLDNIASNDMGPIISS